MHSDGIDEDVFAFLSSSTVHDFTSITHEASFTLLDVQLVADLVLRKLAEEIRVATQFVLQHCPGIPPPV